MPRIRTLKPELWQDEAIGEVSRDARLLFVGLITQADDEGRLRGDPRLLAAQIYPYDDFSRSDLEGWLDELEQAQLVQLYEANGRALICLPAWKSHQKISHPAKSKLPKPPGRKRRRRSGSGAAPEDRGAPPKSSTTIKDQGSRIKERIKEASNDARRRNGADRVRLVFDAWVTATGRDAARTKLTDKRRRLIRKALADYSLEDLVAAVRGWKHSPHHRGENDRDTVYNDLELLLRDAQHIEKFRDLELAKGTKGNPLDSFTREAA